MHYYKLHTYKLASGFKAICKQYLISGLCLNYYRDLSENRLSEITGKILPDLPKLMEL